MTEVVDEGRPEGIRVIARHVGAWLIGLGRSVWLFPLDATFKTVGLRYGWLTLLFKRTPPSILAGLGRLRAERAAWRAARNVPAYRDFLVRNAVDPDDLFPFGILAGCPRPRSRTTSTRTTSWSAASAAPCRSRAPRSMNPAAPRARRTTGSVGSGSERSPIATSHSSRATRSAIDH